MKERKDFSLTINLDHFKLAVQGPQSASALRSVITLLDRLQQLQAGQFEPMQHQCMEGAIGEELWQDKRISKMLQNFSQIYSDFRMNRVSIENNKIVELEQGKIHNQLNEADIRKEVGKLLFRLPKEDVSQIVLHIKGNVSNDDAGKIFDVVQEQFPHTDIKKVQTKSPIQTHTIVEGIFFGEFDQEMEN